MQISKQARMQIFAFSECVLVLPATIFLAAAAVRLMQPPQYQPAHTGWIIVEWTTAHISRSGAAVLFLGLPALAVFVGCSVLISAWRNNQQFRTDMMDALGVLRRQWSIALLSAATLVAAVIVALVSVHVITD